MLKPEPVQIEINVIGNQTGTKFQGLFEVLPRLSIRQELAKDRYYRELIGGDPQYATEGANMLARFLADLRFRVVQSPSWWKDYGDGLELSDTNVVEEIVTKVSEILEKQAARLKAEAEEAQKGLKKE